MFLVYIWRSGWGWVVQTTVNKQQQQQTFDGLLSKEGTQEVFLRSQLSLTQPDEATSLPNA